MVLASKLFPEAEGPEIPMMIVCLLMILGSELKQQMIICSDLNCKGLSLKGAEYLQVLF
jgi:hypothetical protein